MVRVHLSLPELYKWPGGQAVKTPPFHGGNTGSIPVRVTTYAPVAQLDRVFGYEPKGRGFESLSAYQKTVQAFACTVFLHIQKGMRTPKGVCVEAVQKPRKAFGTVKSRAPQSLLVTARSGQKGAGAEYPPLSAKTKILSILVGRIFVLYYSFFIIQYSSFIKTDFRNE